MIRNTNDVVRAQTNALARGNGSRAGASDAAGAATDLLALFAAVRNAALRPGRLDAITDLATSLSDAARRMPSNGDVNEYSRDIEHALGNLKDAGILFLTHPRAGLNSIVTRVRELFETLDLGAIADGLDEAAAICGEQTPAALAAFSESLAEIEASLPPGIDAGLAPLRERVDGLRAVFDGEVKELSTRMEALSERLRELDARGRATDDPDDLAAIVAESQKVAVELHRTAGALADTIDAVRPELAAVREELSTGPLGNDPRVARMVADLETLDASLGEVSATVAKARPFLALGARVLDEAAPYVRGAIDLAENHARAAGTIMDRVMLGVELWSHGRYGKAIGEWLGASGLLPLSLASWGVGATGVAFEHFARFLMREHPAFFPIAWPLLQVGKGLDFVAGGIAWVNDHLVAPVSRFIGGVAGAIGEGVQHGLAAAGEFVAKAGKAAKDAADDFGKKAKKVVDGVVDAGKKLLDSIF